MLCLSFPPAECPVSGATSFDRFWPERANGNTIVWQTHPNAIPIWETRVVPAGAGSQAGNGITAVFEGETA